MASIKTAIELQDNFTSVLQQIINSVNFGISAMEELHQATNSSIAVTSLEIARASIDQTTIAMQKLREATQGIEVPAMQASTTPSVTWQSDNLEVFTGTGVERFKQEIQSANNMLSALRDTQSQIATAANQTNIFPTDMATDMQSMQNRLQAIQQRIQTIEKNSLNVGSATANIELEKLRRQLDQAVMAQQNLNSAVKQMDITSANAAYISLSNTVSSTERYIRDNVNEQGRFNREINNGTSNANKLMSTMSRIVATYASIQGVKKLMNLSDTMTQTTARLDLIVDDGGSVTELEKKIYASAQRSRGAYTSTADAISKLGMQASNAFTSNDELIAFTELLNKQFVIAGTSTQGIDSVMLQLTQGMAAGRLQGEEYRAVLENAAPIIQNIQKYLEQVQGIDASNIKQLAADGVITAEVIKNSMFYASSEINEKFKSMPVTWGQVWQRLENVLLVSFQPMLQIIATGAQLIYDNWSVLEPVFWGLATAVGVLTTAFIAWRIATTLQKIAQDGLNASLLANPVTWVVVVIAAIVGAIVTWINAVGGLETAWMMTCNVVMTAFDWLKIGFFKGVNWVINLWEQIQLSFRTVSTNVANFVGDMKVNVLMILQNMVNSSIDIINEFISTINKIPGVSIDTIAKVNFGTMAQLKNDLEKQVRNTELARYMSEIEANVKTRNEDMKLMETAAENEAMKRQIEIDTKMQENLKNNPPDVYSGYNSALDGIYDNVNKIADSVDISEEELKYIRDIAERDAVNRFTTAEIRIEQVNHNNINSQTDLDGIVSYMVEGVNEAMEKAAEGVHE